MVDGREGRYPRMPWCDGSWEMQMFVVRGSAGEGEGWAAGEVGCGGSLQLAGWWATLIQSL